MLKKENKLAAIHTVRSQACQANFLQLYLGTQFCLFVLTEAISDTTLRGCL